MALLQDNLEGPLNSNGDREGGSPYVEAVSLPGAVLKRMLSRGIPFETAIDQIDGVLLGKGPLNVRLTDVGVLRGEYMRKEIIRVANDDFGLNAEFVERGLMPPSFTEVSEEDEKTTEFNQQLTDYVAEQPLYHLCLLYTSPSPRD